MSRKDIDIMRRVLLQVVGMLALLMVAGGIILLSSRAPTNTVQAASIRHNIHAQKPSARSPGVPAITPHLSNTGGPSFTTEDVKQYLMTHSLPGQFALSPGTKLTIVSILFLPSKEVTQLTGESTGMPDSYLLCYVKLQGTVKVSGPGNTNDTFQTIEIVFDAQSGNLLMIGAR